MNPKTNLQAGLESGVDIMWKITKDHISDGDAVGTKSRNYDEQFEYMLKHEFKIYDDDGTLYYQGVATNQDCESAFEPLDWAMYDAGATEIKYLNNKTKVWETL